MAPRRQDPNETQPPFEEKLTGADVLDVLSEMRSSMREIKTALVGKPELGQKGVIPRLEEVEKVQADHTKKIIWISAAVGGASVSLSSLAEKLLS